MYHSTKDLNFETGESRRDLSSKVTIMHPTEHDILTQFTTLKTQNESLDPRKHFVPKGILKNKSVNFQLP